MSNQIKLRVFAISLALFILCACTKIPRLQESTRQVSELPFYRAGSVPVILVGQILGSIKIGPVRASKFSAAPSQLCEVRVSVLHVLRGSVPKSEVSVYYFTDWGPIGGPPRLGMAENAGTWQLGDVAMFFLRWESGVLHTICDYQRACVVPVFSGSHPDFKIESNEPTAASISRFLLTVQLQQYVDSNMVKEIYTGDAERFSKTYAADKFRQLITSPSGAIRGAACDALRNLGQPCSLSISLQ